MKNVIIKTAIILCGIWLVLCCSQPSKMEPSGTPLSGTGIFFTIEQYDKLPKGPNLIAVTSTKQADPTISTEAEALPLTYTTRHFISSFVDTYDPSIWPGNIIRYNSAKKDYEVVSLTRYVLNNEYPKNEIIQDGILYDSKFTNGSSFNGSGLVGNLSVATDQLAELVIQDVMKSAVPDNLILKEAILKAVRDVPSDEIENYYFLKGVTLTLINYRIFRESKFNAKLACSFITLNRKTYSSFEKMKRERMISADLVSLKDVLAGIK